MAALTTAQENIIWRTFIERNPGMRVDWDQPGLRTAAAAINNWIDANQASLSAYMQANAPAFWNNSTLAQKTLLFVFVAELRGGVI